MERQLQAVNSFETEEFHGLKKMKNKTPNPPKITHLICTSTRRGVLERSPAVDDVMGTSMGSVGTGRDSRAAAEGPEDPSALGPFPREPLGSHYPGGAHGDTGGQHEAGPAHVPWAGSCWCSLTKLPGLRELFPSPQGRSSDGVGQAGPRFPIPSCSQKQALHPASPAEPVLGWEFGTGCPHLARLPAELALGQSFGVREPDTNVLGHGHTAPGGIQPSPAQVTSCPQSHSPSHAVRRQCFLAHGATFVSRGQWPGTCCKFLLGQSVSMAEHALAQ